MTSNKYERDFTAQGNLKRPGRIDLRIFQNVPNAGDGFGGIQYMLQGIIGGLFSAFVIEDCEYNGSDAINAGYVCLNGQVVKVLSQNKTVNNNEYLYVDEDGIVQTTSTESTALQNVIIYYRDGSGTGTDIRFFMSDNLLQVYDLLLKNDATINGNLVLDGTGNITGTLDVHSNIDLNNTDLKDVKAIDGGGNSIVFNDALDINGKNITNIGSNNVNINSLIQNEIDQIANINALTINNTKWGYLANADQGIAKATNPFEAVRLTLSQTTGTAPLTISSTTKVTNLNVDWVDGVGINSLSNTNRVIKYAGSNLIGEGNLVDNAGALSGIITINMSGQLTSTLAIGTKPFVITSTTKVDNLNAHYVNGVTTATLTSGRLMRYNSSGTQIENATVTETAGALGGITTLSMSGALTVQGGINLSTTNLSNVKEIILTEDPAVNQTVSAITSTVQVDDAGVIFGDVLKMGAGGNYARAMADAVGTLPAMVMALEAGSGSKKILHRGYVRNDTWNWTTIGGLIYVSSGTSGRLTQTAPTTSGHFVQVVGYAVTADIMFFDPNTIYLELF